MYIYVQHIRYIIQKYCLWNSIEALHGMKTNFADDESQTDWFLNKKKKKENP